ncbi:MAG: hypothetical protein GX640_07550, partial [Fibrobacter sp.]|nr:hypothetical protein [Fibrobacter sp.]
MKTFFKTPVLLCIFLFSTPHPEEYVSSISTISTTDNTLTISLYTPRGYGPFPAVIILPGGHGPKEIGKAWPHYHDYAKKLTGSGISAMVVNYSNPKRSFLDPKNIDDINVSIEFPKNQDRIQKQNIFLTGFSMGGANGLRVAGSGADIAGLICLFAPYDFRVSSKKLPFTINKQPIEYCDSITCPILILQGAKDQITRVDQAILLQKKL